MAEWQKRWSSSTNGRWTHRLIPDVARWVERKHGVVDYYLTQFLSGHGCFKKYLFKRNLATSAICTFCNDSKDEDVEHIFFECSYFRSFSIQLEARLGVQLTAVNIVQVMLYGAREWMLVHQHVIDIMKVLIRAESARQV